MRIEKKDIAKVIELSNQRREEFDITFDHRKIAAFKQSLEAKAKEKYTTEGVKLSEEDFNELKGNIVDLLGNVVHIFSQLTSNVKRDLNVKDYLLVGQDYLIAMMADGLNCPEIPREYIMSLKPDLEVMTRRMLEAKPEPLKTPKEYFDEQRRMDADVVSKKIETVMNNVKNNPINPSYADVGTLYAEYQALAKRQAGHGAFWRLFHGKENEKRMNLLAEMRGVLSKHIPDKLDDLANTTPTDIVRYVESRDLDVAIHNDMDSREKNFEKSMEKFSPYRVGKFEGTMLDFLKVEYRPTLTDLKGEMVQMSKLYHAIKRGDIFKDDKTVNKLITRNYLRLQTAEKMALKNPEEWEKYCASEDEDFKSAYNIYETKDGKTVVVGTTLVLPDEVPEIPEVPEEPTEPERDDQKELTEQLMNDTSDNVPTTDQKSNEAPANTVINVNVMDNGEMQVVEEPVVEEPVVEEPQPVNKEEEQIAEEAPKSLDDLTNDIVANALGDAMAELEDEANSEEIANDFVDDLLAGTSADIEREQREREELRKLEEEAERKALADELAHLEQERIRLEEELRISNEELIEVSDLLNDLNQQVADRREHLMQTRDEELARLDEERIKLEEELRQSEEALKTLEEERKQEIENDQKAIDERQEKLDEMARKINDDMARESGRRAERSLQSRLNEEIQNKREEQKKLDANKRLEEQKALKKKGSKGKVADVVGPVPTKEDAKKIQDSAKEKEETKKFIAEAMQIINDKSQWKMDDGKNFMFDMMVNIQYALCSSNAVSGWNKFEEAYTPEGKEDALKHCSAHIFSKAFYGTDTFTYGICKADITNADRWIIAQTVTDFMLNKYSPVASNSKYEKFGKNYFSQNPDHDFLSTAFEDHDEIEKTLDEVSKRLNIAVPNVDYSLIDLVKEKNALDSKIYNESYAAKSIRARDNKELAKSIKDEIANNLKNLDVSEGKAKFIADSVFDKMSSMAYNTCNEVDDETDNKERQDVMHKRTSYMFNEAYTEIRNSFIIEDVATRVVMAQKIVDMALKLYSPAAFENGTFDKYADNFILNDEEGLRDILAYLNEPCTDTDEAFAEFMKEVSDVRAGKLPKAETEDEIERDEEEPEQTDDEADKENELEAQKRIDEENKKKEEEARQKEEEEARRKAEEEEARRKAEEEARRKAEEEEARRKAEEEARQKEEEARASLMNVVEDPVVEDPVVEEPVVEEPVVEEPVVEEPKVEEPKVEEPVVEEPVVEEPAVEEPEENDLDAANTLVEKKNPFAVDNKRRKGYVPGKVAPVAKIYFEERELNNENVIKEDALEDEEELDEELPVNGEPNVEEEFDFSELTDENLDADAKKQADEELRKTLAEFRKESKERAEKAQQAAAEADKARRREELKVRNNKITLRKDEKGNPKKRMPDELSFYGVESNAESSGKYKSSIRGLHSSDFETVFNKVRADNDLTEKVKGELIAAMRDGNLCENDEDLLEYNADKFLELLDNIPLYYAPDGNDRAKSSMDDYVWKMYDLVSCVFNDPNCEINEFSDPETRIIQNQKITDILIKNYPPISNSKEDLGKYARNYVIHNTRLLNRAFRALGITDKAELYGANVTSVALESGTPYKTGAHIPSIRNRVAMEERAQEIANTPESEMTAPMREQISILGLSESVGGKEVSEMHKESEAVSKTNVRE